MSGTICFHLDENVSHAIAEGLQRRGIDVTTTPGEGLIAASDQEQLEYACSKGRVLFTHDADLLRLHQAGASHAGIVYSMQGRRSTGEVIRGLVMIWELLEPEEMMGHVEFL